MSSLSNWNSFVKKINGKKELRIIDGVDHFWFGSENLLGNIVIEWLQSISTPLFINQS